MANTKTPRAAGPQTAPKPPKNQRDVPESNDSVTYPLALLVSTSFAHSVPSGDVPRLLRACADRIQDLGVRSECPFGCDSLDRALAQELRAEIAAHSACDPGISKLAHLVGQIGVLATTIPARLQSKLGEHVITRWSTSMVPRCLLALVSMAVALSQSRAPEAAEDLRAVGHIYGLLRRTVPLGQREYPAFDAEDPRRMVDAVTRLVCRSQGGVTITVQPRAGTHPQVEVEGLITPNPAMVRRLKGADFARTLLWAVDPNAEVRLPPGGRSAANTVLDKLGQAMLCTPPWIDVERKKGGRATSDERRINYPEPPEQCFISIRLIPEEARRA